MRHQVINCNPKVYSTVTMKLSMSAVTSKFVYKVDPKVLYGSNKLLILYDSQSKCFKIINKALAGSKIAVVPLSDYNFIEIQFVPTLTSGYGRTFTWICRKLQNYVINTAPRLPRGGKKLIKSPVKPVAATYLFVENQSLVKPYWKKHGDVTRSQFSRVWRYNTLAGMYTDARVSTSYRSKFVLTKYLSWKFGMSVKDLAKLGSNSSLSTKLLLSLIHFLLLIGACRNVSTAKQILATGKLLINGQVVTNPWYQVQVNDLIAFSSSTPSKFVMMPNKFVEAYPGDVFIIKSLPTAADVQLLQLNKYSQGNAIKLLNPLNTVFNRANPVVNRLFKA